MDNILRSLKKISTGLIFTTDKELASTNVYTSYEGVYKNKKCTIFKYKGAYSTVAEESYPLLKYVQDLLHIAPEVLASQKHNSSFYIITDRIFPVITQEEITSSTVTYKVFNEFISTNISQINNELLKKHSIILTSLGNMSIDSNTKINSAVLGNSNTKNTAGSSKEMPERKNKMNIDYADIYYDINNNTKAMVLPIFTAVNNIVCNPENIIYKIHKVLHSNSYRDIYNVLQNNTKILPPHYLKYITGILLLHIETQKIKIAEIKESITNYESGKNSKNSKNSKKTVVNASVDGKNSAGGNDDLQNIVNTLFLFDVQIFYDILSLYSDKNIIYTLLYFINQGLYALSLSDINDLFLYINTNINKYYKNETFCEVIVEILFNSLHVLSSSNRILFVQLLIKYDMIVKEHHGSVKNNMTMLIEIENVYNLLIHLLSSQCTVSYRLGIFILYNNIDRIGVESMLLEIIDIVSKKCLKDEVANESVELLKYVVDYINNNISEIKKSKGIKIKKQKKVKKKDTEDEWEKRNKMYLSKIENTTVSTTEWDNNEW
ncbi:hypothetical protein NEMIN01_2388 [Nematocida minor]|uniref:uncharacterized protein n=1 Tax=Nematocida minor TaxID=1912983 RepID=UPI0022206FD0|nr:uncharacterized protein NEMIN01_2388 [Nematocida minor]KAI5193056.1 hypothetical protein NEMIN01_2388 [Nematocida minor]